MRNDLFRKKSLEKISSPERIDDYVKTVNIRLWIVVVSCFAVICSLSLWGIFGRIEISEKTVTVCKNGNAMCFLNEKNLPDISSETEFVIGEKIYKAESISETPSKALKAMDEYCAHVAEFGEEDWVFEVLLNADLSDGIYETTVVTATVSPVSLLMK